MNKNPLKRLVSFALSLFMTFSIIFADNAIITAFAEETNVKTYNYDNFKVEYIIDSEWEGAQSVRIKISNTGDEAILNWYLKYNTSGTIENIYNATIYSESNGEYILKHNGYNYEIGAGNSVEFGYILKGDNLVFPEVFKMCNKRVDKESGYTVDFNIISEWDAGFNADIVITNNTDSPIEAWTLAFDSNFNINNYWNCKLISNESGRYNFANQLWTTPIPAGGTASFGFTADKIDGETPIAENWVLTEVVIDLTTIVEPQNFSIFGFIEYVADSNSLSISWISEYDEGVFEIYTSNDGITFEKYTEVSNCNSYTYAVTEDFDKRYFIIKQILDNGNIGESSIILITKGENGYSMEFPDSDSDGVADYLEEAFGLDVNKTDTDDDNLSDYEEMFITGTDPTVYDSVKKDVSDAEADSDDDGLTNKQELSVGTNPVIPDSDDDNLTDGDEVNKYGTNPLIPDSDDDKINDGDEIKLGLDPLNPNTFGVPDSEYTFNIELTDNSDAMSEINTSDNEYKLSIELKAAGNVSENISVTESNYSEAIKNSAIIGKSFDIEYDEACKVDEVVIKFTLNEDTITESELGIERYCVFKLFEEYNILLPVYTEYDLNNGKLSSQVDELGTYCLMDMEKLVDSFYSASETQETEQSTEAVQPIMLYSSRNSGVWQNGIDKSSINVVFILDIRDNIDDESFENIKTNIVKTAAEVLKESSNAKIYLLLQHYDKVSSNMLGYTVLDDDEQEFFTDSVKIYNALDEIRTNSVADVNNYCILSDAIKYVYDNCDNSSGTYCFSIFDSADVVYRTSLIGEDIIGVTESDDYGYEVLNKLRENTIDVSVISNIAPEYNLGYAIDLYDSTGGIYIDGFGDISDEMLEHIYGYVPNNESESEVVFNGINFERLDFNEPITKNYLTVAEELNDKMHEILNSDDKSELIEMRDNYSDYADSDGDYVYDFEEIDVFNPMINWDQDENIVLPTIEDYCNEMGDKKVTKAMNEYIKENWEPLITVNVMPLISNPMKSDTDGDGFEDYYEIIYNKNKAITSYSQKDNLDNSLYYLDPISKNQWEPKSDLAHMIGISGYVYDPEQHILYSKQTPIQRFFGFAETIDLAADPVLSSAIFCDPIYFYYDDKEYLLELWKGQYGLMSGTEIGLYYRNPCTVIGEYTISEAIDELSDIVNSIEKYENIDNIVKNAINNRIDSIMDNCPWIKNTFDLIGYTFNADEVIRLYKEGINVADYLTDIIEGSKLDYPVNEFKNYDDTEEKWFRSAEKDDTIKMSYTIVTNKLDTDGAPMKDINGDPYTEEHPTDYIDYNIDTDHWWATGFEWGKYTDKEAFIEMIITLEFNNKEMASAFINGGEPPYELYEESTTQDTLINMQKLGLDKAIDSSAMNDNSSTIHYGYDGDCTVTITYKNYCITGEESTDTKQEQSSANKIVIQEGNWEAVQGYKRAKEIAGIPFEYEADGKTEHILYTNDPNLMTIKDLCNGLVDNGFFVSDGFINHMKQLVKMGTLGITADGELKFNLSLGAALIEGSFGEGYGYNNQLNTYASLVNSIINYKNSGGPIVYDFIITQTEDAVIEAVINRDDFDTMCQNWLNDIFDGAGSLGTLMYYDKSGEAVYLYELYDEWYEQYVNMYGIDNMYADSRYYYALNHLMGMVMSAEFISQQINQLTIAS